jgi:hypothetical protein
MRAIMDYFPGLGPSMNRAVGATDSMRQVIELREGGGAGGYGRRGDVTSAGPVRRGGA